MSIWSFLPQDLCQRHYMSTASILPIVRARGARAKVRTGGVVVDVIPEVGPLAPFLEACALD